MNRFLPLLLILFGAPAFANEETPSTFNGIVQDDITLYHGCGAACHYRHFQLTEPVIEDGWTKLKVMSAGYLWKSKEGRYVPWKFRYTIDKEPDNADIFWIFANCKSKKVAYGRTSNLSKMNEPQDVYYGAEMGEREGEPQIASMNHAPYSKWAPLCLENQSPGKERGYVINKKVLLAHYKDVMKKQAEELKSKAIDLVFRKYDKRLKERIKGTGKNPSYMAWVDDDCNVSVKSGTHQPGKWTANQSFDVDVCKGEAKRWRWSRKEGKVYDDDF